MRRPAPRPRGASRARRSASTAAPSPGSWAANGHVRAYLGLPFAAPPLGDLRWKPPQPVTPWQGVRAATSFGPQCLQPGGSPKSVYFEYSGGDLPSSEDCLTLNVWAPTDAKDLPVMVWIYGGGFQVGRRRVRCSTARAWPSAA